MMVQFQLGIDCYGRPCTLCYWYYYLRQGGYDERKATFIGCNYRSSRDMELKTEYKFGLGMLVSIISGVLSACFNFGLEAGKANGGCSQRYYGKLQIREKGIFYPE